ncbi:MAG: hypothetical protein NVSMB39_5890 [Candidatus Saccharimonadales bacterium]
MSPDISTKQKWRDHFDKIAVTRVQTPERLIARREALIAAVCAYFSAKYSSPAGRKRSSMSTIVQTRGRLKNAWKCDEAWIKHVDKLGTQFDIPPGKYELSKFLDFPARTAPSLSRSNRKRNHAA